MTQTNVRVFLRKFEASKFSLAEFFPLFACLAGAKEEEGGEGSELAGGGKEGSNGRC